MMRIKELQQRWRTHLESNQWNKELIILYREYYFVFVG